MHFIHNNNEIKCVFMFIIYLLFVLGRGGFVYIKLLCDMYLDIKLYIRCVISNIICRRNMYM